MKAGSLEVASWMVKGALIACQPLDVALTAWMLAMYTAIGAHEANPIVEPLTGSPWGLAALLVLKLVLAVRIATMRVRCVPDLAAVSVALLVYLVVVGWNAWAAMEAATVVRA